MFSVLLAVIYIAFISLGLPDSVLGSAWPVMYKSFNVPVSFAGIVTFIIAGGTIISSLFSDRLTKKLGTGLVTMLSVLLTALALLGFSLSHSFVLLCVIALPYGLGAGAVDAALNNFVAVHYSSRHMNWLHCFWGVGASIGPYIMGFALTKNLGWNSGYFILFVIQAVLTVVLFLSLPLWKKKTAAFEEKIKNAEPKSLKEILKINGVQYILPAFFGYCAFESTTGVWASSFLVLGKQIDATTAAAYASMFFIGITAGRFAAGFVSEKIGDKNLIRLGLIIISAGIVLVSLPVSSNLVALAGLIIIGFGSAPIYPSFIHSTPEIFGKENSQAIVGIQMASAYTGTTLIPPIFGILAQNVSINLYPPFLLLFVILTFVMSELLNKKIRVKKA
jgi:fucose permease